MNKIDRLKRIGLLAIVILSFQLTFSQENYIPGYVIKNNSDTLFGFVDYRNWKNNPDLIKFKTNIEKDPISFMPTDIAEFKVKDEIYVSGFINTEVTPIQTDKLKVDPKIKIKVDTTFLQTLFRGKKSLYYYKNSDGKENFYIKQNDGFDLLIYKKYLKKQDGKDVVTENKKYLGQLTLYLNDCPTINSKLENTSYKQKSLLKLFQYYYECSSSDIYFQKEIESIHAEFGVLAGVTITSLEFGSDAFPYLVNAEYNSSNSFSAGLFLNLILPRNQRKWSINNEILYSTYKVMGSYEENEFGNQNSLITTEIGYSYLKINNLVRFKYPVDNLFLFLNGGISNGFSISETNYKKEESRFRTKESVALNDTRKYEQGLILGSGVMYKRFSFEIRYEMGNGMSKYSGLNSSTKRYHFLLGYRF